MCCGANDGEYVCNTCCGNTGVVIVDMKDRFPCGVRDEHVIGVVGVQGDIDPGQYLGCASPRQAECGVIGDDEVLRRVERSELVVADNVPIGLELMKVGVGKEGCFAFGSRHASDTASQAGVMGMGCCWRVNHHVSRSPPRFVAPVCIKVGMIPDVGREYKYLHQMGVRGWGLGDGVGLIVGSGGNERGEPRPVGVVTGNLGKHGYCFSAFVGIVDHRGACCVRGDQDVGPPVEPSGEPFAYGVRHVSGAVR